LTPKQKLGLFGEALVAKHCRCARCKRRGSLKRLPTNFKCADLICDFCGYLAQVKASTCLDVAVLPKTLLGAAWSVQKDRMDAGIYFPLFIVLVQPGKAFAIYYLSADLQTPDMFLPRKPLSLNARRAGWQGFMYDFQELEPGAIVRLIKGRLRHVTA
jgi:type II restriction enzyme